MRRGSGFEAVGLFVALPSAEESLSFQSLLPRPVRTGQRWNAASGPYSSRGSLVVKMRVKMMGMTTCMAILPDVCLCTM